LTADTGAIMAGKEGKLTARQCETLPDGKYSAGDRLRLTVRGDSRSWQVQYTIHGERREMGLGKLSKVSLRQARTLALAGEQPSRRWHRPGRGRGQGSAGSGGEKGGAESACLPQLENHARAGAGDAGESARRGRGRAGATAWPPTPPPLSASAGLPPGHQGNDARANNGASRPCSLWVAPGGPSSRWKRRSTRFPRRQLL